MRGVAPQRKVAKDNEYETQQNGKVKLVRKSKQKGTKHNVNKVQIGNKTETMRTKETGTQ